MAKKTKKEQQQQRAQQARQKLIGLCVLGVLIINVGLGYWLYGTMVLEVQQERLQQLTRQKAQEQAEQIAAYLQSERQKLLALADDEATLAAMQSGEEATRIEQQEQIASHFEHVLAVRLIPNGTAQLERQHEARIGFAELELIRKAERRERHYPEVARVEQQWQLHLITPLPTQSDEPAVGTLLVTLTDQALRAQLSASNPQLGRIRVRQQIPGSGQVAFFQQGQGDAGPEYATEVANSHWHLSFSPSAELVSQSRELPTLWLLVLSATTIGGLVLAWVLGYILTKRQAQAPGSHASATSRQSSKPTTNPNTNPTAKQGAATNNDAELAEAGLANDSPMIGTIYQNQDILDLDVDDEDEDILELSQTQSQTRNQAQGRAQQAAEPASSAPALSPTLSKALAEGIFRSYDIRGLADTQLTPELAEHIGRALGSEALEQGETHILLARDGRTHSPVLSESLREGLLSTGCHVIDIGIVPTPVLYFATHHLEETNSGVMVTASHNSAEYNGFKMVINGTTLADEAVLDVRSRIQHQRYHSGQGETQYRDISSDYIERIFSDVALVGTVSLVIDAGNAVTGDIAPRLFEELGCDVTTLYCDLDGSFPNHDPDPTQEANLQDLIAKVQDVGADLGVAFDGDGDRLIVVTPQGHIIWPDQLLMLFARDILSRHPGADVLFDVKCSRQLNQLITSYGGRPIMWKTGHSHMKSKMIETGALIGGEYSGHIFIKDRWYGFDDGLYALARLLEIITLRDQPIDDIFAAFPTMPSTPELKIPVPDGEKFALIEQLIAQGEFLSGKATTIDGLRVDFAKGWGLVRASNTSASLTLRFEAESEETLEKIQQLFKRELLKVNSSLIIDF